MVSELAAVSLALSRSISMVVIIPAGINDEEGQQMHTLSVKKGINLTFEGAA